ncbi:MAG: pyrroline-5-carboxylate reductase [Crocinitomicaceae bacterium]|nr:pyrroline-5-carboxylate reductase [Crocinitomicaceae bacterium]
MVKIGIIGCGNLGLSILSGIQHNMTDVQLFGSKRDLAKLEEFEQVNTTFTTDNELLIKESDIIVIALKPYTLLSFLETHSSLLDPERHTIVSCATGITLEQIQSAIKAPIGIYRAMPNTAAAVNESVTAISCTSDPLNRKEMIDKIFASLGTVIHIDEALMESATILGACGVAYVLRFMRAMIQGGIEVGFNAQTATDIVSQTMKGAAELIIQNGTHPEEEIDKVTTPKGCTIVGLNEMEHAGFSSALIKGIVASYNKIER